MGATGADGARPAAPKVRASKRCPADSSPRAQRGGAATAGAQRGGAAAAGTQKGGAAASGAQRGGGEEIAMIMKNTAAQEEQTKKMEEQTRRMERQTQEPEPRGEEPPLPEPRGEEPPLPEPRGEEGRSIPPPQPQPPPLQFSSALLRPVPQPLLLDTLPVFLDLPVLDLEPRSLQHWPQLCPWFPAPLSPSTQTSLGCCQTSLLLPLFAASLPLGDRTSLRRFPAEDLGPLRHPPVPRPTLRSALSARWGKNVAG
ncbi:UNVERIFIED_CONTAM: hypothetical protein FKN15_050600 [Acipenser sinensis]